MKKIKKECINCCKKYKTEKLVSYLCPNCKQLAENETDEHSKLKLFWYMCEELGIVSIMS